MCFSAEVSLGVAATLLPTGAVCLAAAWRKDRSYMPLAAMPVLFGVQQLCEAQVWAAAGWGTAGAGDAASLAFLFFALAFWPIWVPLAVAAAEPPGRRRWAIAAAALLGAAFAAAFYLPLVLDPALMSAPSVVGHSLHYDLSAALAVDSRWWWVLPVVYVGAVAGPLLSARERRLRPLGAAVAVSAVIAYAAFEYAFASVWCFFAAVLSLHLAYVLVRLPDRQSGNPGTTVTEPAL